MTPAWREVVDELETEGESVDRRTRRQNGSTGEVPISNALASAHGEVDRMKWPREGCTNGATNAPRGSK